VSFVCIISALYLNKNIKLNYPLKLKNNKNRTTTKRLDIHFNEKLKLFLERNTFFTVSG